MIRYYWKLREKMHGMVSLLSTLKSSHPVLSLAIVLLSSYLLTACVHYFVFSFRANPSLPSTPMMSPKKSLFSSGFLGTNGKTQKSIPSLQEESGTHCYTQLHFKSEQSSRASGHTSKKGPVSNGRRRWRR